MSLPIEVDVSKFWVTLAAARLDQGRFADAVSSEQPENLPLLELQGHALQDVGVTVIGVYVLHFEERHQTIPR